MILSYKEIVDAVIKSIQTDATKELQEQKEILVNGIRSARATLYDNQENYRMMEKLTQILKEAGV